MQITINPVTGRCETPAGDPVTPVYAPHFVLDVVGVLADDPDAQEVLAAIVASGAVFRAADESGRVLWYHHRPDAPQWDTVRAEMRRLGILPMPELASRLRAFENTLLECVADATSAAAIDHLMAAADAIARVIAHLDGDPFAVSWDTTRRLLIDAMWVCADTPVEAAYDALLCEALDREEVAA